MRSVFIIIFGICSFTLMGQEAFSYLTSLELGNADACKIEGVESEPKIHFDPNKVRIVNKEVQYLETHNPLRDELRDTDILVLYFNPPENPNKELALLFSWGPSCDPHFYVFDSENDSIGRNFMGGTELFMPQNDKFYTVGRYNAPFTIRKKFVLLENYKTVEIEPEFYHLGLQTETLRSIKLYTDRQMNTEIAALPPNYKIEVVLAYKKDNLSEFYYLIKTQLGLLGWANIETGYSEAIDVKGIFWIGD
ncbi:MULTISPECIES: hypothetical protein [Roseivirga]|uniref:hypothetical protein n=1 Tax=Roseivirga TaxID=290180 RepID=UPI00257F6E6D|nr:MULTISPECIES: hypothetical protein [Roseivirga]